MNRRAAFLASAALAAFSAACGGGSSTPPPPPPTGGFTLASLKGNYAFSMSGQDINFNSKQRVGSFIADGQGNITQAIEDVNTGGTINNAVTFTGTYTIQSNGRGQIILNAAVGNGLILSFTMSSPAPAGQGFLIETDPNLLETASGSFTQQNIGDFSQPFQSANYVFDFSGESLSAGGFAPLSIVGQFSANTGGGIIGGLMDVNDGNQQAPSGPLAINSNGQYLLDPTNAATFGRGTATFAGLSFVFYTVDNTHTKFLETDGAGFTLGDALLQAAPIPQSTAQWNAGNFAYLVAGAAAGQVSFTPLANASAFQTSGGANGALGNIVSTDNNNGTITQTSSGLTGTYAIDAANAGSGRGTLTINVSQGNPFTAVYYLVSQTQAVIQDTSNGVIADGSLAAQAPLNGTNFAFNLSGENLSAGFEEDYVGQYSTSGSGQFNGAVDFTQLGSTGSQFIFPDVPVNATGTFPGSGKSTFQVVTGNTPSTTLKFDAYPTSQGVLLISTQNTRTTVGIVTAQP